MSKKPELHVVPKPEGYDLRDRRRRKEADGSLWDPQDALYCASQRIAKAEGRVTGLVVIWREEFDDDTCVTDYRSAGPHGQPQLSVMTIFGRMMGWR